MVHSNIVITHFVDPCMVYCNIDIVDPLMDLLVSEPWSWYTLDGTPTSLYPMTGTTEKASQRRLQNNLGWFRGEVWVFTVEMRG